MTDLFCVKTSREVLDAIITYTRFLYTMFALLYTFFN